MLLEAQGMDHMHEMGGMHDHAMSMTLLPTWLGVVLGIVSLLVVVPHIRHVAATVGQHRWWHVGHIVMAIGMARMYLFGMGPPAVDGISGGLFIAITFIVLVAAVWCRLREGVVNPLWVATALDMAAMAYMHAPASLRPTPVTGVIIVYLVAQAVMWASGAWGRVPVFAILPEPVPADAVPRFTADTEWSAGSAASGVPSGSGGVTVAPRPRPGLSGRKDRGVRFTLTIMSLAMAYMLLAMV